MAGGKELKTSIVIAGDLDASLRSAIDAAAKQMDKMGDAALEAAGAAAKLAMKISDQSDELKKAKQRYASYVLAGEESSEQAKELAKKIKTLSRELSANSDVLEAAENAADKLSDGFDDASDSAKDASGGFTVMKGALANLVADGFSRAIDAAKDFASSMVTTAAEVKAQNSQFAQTFGTFSDDAEGAIKRVADNAGILETRLQATGTQIYAFAKTSGMESTDALGLMERALAVTADQAAYYDKSLDDVAESLQSFLKGNYENDAALGLSATETTRNAKANELYGKSFNDLAEDQKQLTLLQMVEDANKLSGALGQAARESDGWENVTGNLSETWRQFKANVGMSFLENLVPIIQNVTASFQAWSENVDWDAFGETVSDIFQMVLDGFTWVGENKDIVITAVSAITAAFLTYKAAMVVSTIASKALKGAELIKAAAEAKGTAITTAAAVAQWALNGAIAFITSPITIAVAAIAALVAAVVWLYRNWDTAKLKVEQFGAKVGEIWGNISDFIGNAILTIGQYFPIFGGYLSGWWSSIQDVAENVKAIFHGVIDFISNVFAGNWSAAWDNIVSIFGNIFGGMINIAKIPINGVIGAINAVISGINGAGFDIPDWVPVIGGKSFRLEIPQIPMLAKGGFTDGVSIAGEAGTEAVISFKNAYRKQNLGYWAQAGRMLGATPDDFSLSGGGTTTNSIDLSGIQFAPNIRIYGNAGREEIMQALRDAESEFRDFLLDILDDWRGGAYEPEPVY